MLESFNYRPKDKAARRRRILKNAIQTHSFDSIYQDLRNFKEKVEGYKLDRVEYDLRWLKKNSHKYYTQILDRENTQQNKVTN